MVYRYYAVQKPITDPTTVMVPDNRIISFMTFDKPIMIKAARKQNPDFMAYGYIDYEKPLTLEEMNRCVLFTDQEYLICDSYVFQVVHYLPRMEVWNIRDDMIEGYIPFCRLSSDQRFPGGRQVDTNYLLAVKTPYAREIMHAVSLTGEHQIESLVRFLEDYLAKGTKKYRTEFNRVLQMIMELQDELRMS